MVNGVQNEDEGPADILDDDLQQQLNEMADYNSDEEEKQQPSTSQADAGKHASMLLCLLAQLCFAA